LKNGQFLAAMTDQGGVMKWNQDLESVRFDTANGSDTLIMLPTNFVMEADVTFHDCDFIFYGTLTGRRVMSLEDGRILGSPESSGGNLGGSAISRDGRRQHSDRRGCARRPWSAPSARAWPPTRAGP